MDQLLTVLKGVLPPIAAALLLVSLGGARLLGVAAAGSLLLVFGLLKAWPALPNELWQEPDGKQWLLWCLVLAALVSLGERLRVLPAKAGPAIAVLLAATTTVFVLQKVSASWSAGHLALQLGTSALVLALLALGHRRLLAARQGLLVPILLTLCLSVDAGLLTLGRSALLGQLCGAMAAALGAGIFTSLWRRSFQLTAADAAWLAIAHGGFLLAGVQLAEVALPAALCAAAAPCAPLLLGNRLGAANKPTAVLATLLTLAFATASLLLQPGATDGY